MSAQVSQNQSKLGSSIHDHNQLQNFQKLNQQVDIKHSNEFLSNSYDELDQNNHCSIGQGYDNISSNDSQEINTQQQQEQERHINELIDNYNSQHEFYKPQKQWQQQINQEQRTNQNENKGDYYKQKNNQLSQSNSIQQSNILNHQVLKSVPPSAEEKSKNQYINQSGAAQIKSFQNEEYEFCPNCNRRFFAGRLNLHLKSCKPNKPLKPQKKQSQPSDQNINEQEKHSGQKTSPSKQNPSSISFSDLRMNDSNKGITVKKQSNQYQKNQTSKLSNQDSTKDNSEKDDSYSQQQSKYNIEQFEHKISNNQIDSNEDSRVECSICSRKFMPERIEKHQDACIKSQKARPVYNSTAARCPEDENGQKLIPKVKLQPPQAAKKISEQSVLVKKGVSQIKNDNGSPKENQNDNASTLQKHSTLDKKITYQQKNNTTMNSSSNTKEEEKTKKVPKWKLEHQQFIENIRYNKMIQQVQKEGGDISKIEKPVDNLEALGYVSCQYCLRKFAKETAERHIPLCKNIINRPKPPRQPSRQHSDKLTASNNQNNENKKPNARKITTKNNFSNDEELQLKQSISNIDSQYQTNDNSEQGSIFSYKTLNTTGGYSNTLKQSQKLSTENNQKCRTGLLPDINLKQQADKKYYTSRKFGTYNNKNHTTSKDGNSAIQKTYEDVYTRTSQISSVSCPHCERVFAKKAADRHIPICKNIVNRPNPLQDITRNMRQSLPKKMSTQQVKSTQRQSLGQSQQILNTDSCKIVKEGVQKARTNENSQYSKMSNSLTSAQSQNFCGFCGFQFAMDYKYCGSCGKKRFSTLNKSQLQNTQISQKNIYDSTLNNNITTIIE